MRRTLCVIAMGGMAMLFNCSGTRPGNLGVRDGRLAPCPDTPNCVSTFAADSTHQMPAIAYAGTLEEARAKLVTVIESLPRTRIITQDGAYVYAEFTSAFWRFVDDVEFVFDDAAKVIHFRSASRLGKSDFGVNRKRMETVSALFAKQ